MDIIQYSLPCNSKAFQTVNDEYRMLDSMKFETEEANESYKAKYMINGSSFDISISEPMDECSCLTFCNFGLHAESNSKAQSMKNLSFQIGGAKKSKNKMVQNQFSLPELQQ